MPSTVSAIQETIYIPTYAIGRPEKNPVFLEKRVYQGSSGVVYPHPVIEKVSDEKTDQPYQAVMLENEFLRIMILPELGGRIHRAYDKIRQRDFVYYNQVIKPALVGLAGPWISGGIEFNWPQHHRPSTFQPVDHCIIENADGSVTVWVNEVEKMFRTKCQTGFTLYPDKAYLEVKGKLYNRTPFPQTFLWWANPAVKANEHYQSVFPPDVHAVFDHGKRDVSSFPIATGTYYNVNYAPGTDISRYSNIPVPTSYMAINSAYDFMGGYEHDTQAGLLHVANHHIAPGKKQWTWGCGDFGKAWDRNLTDEDGPYVELMTGVFTDNQPDFSWLQPFEEKAFEQYFMPYASIGMVKNATKEAAINVEQAGNGIRIAVYSTSFFKGCQITVSHKTGLTIHSITADLSPAEPLDLAIAIDHDISSITAAVMAADGRELVKYTPLETRENEIPAPASAAKDPADIEQVEELFLNGLHLEQYRHATYSPVDYYQEGLRRSPGDIRCNNAMGSWLMRHGKPSLAQPYFEKAIATATLRNPNPYDGEPYYNYGCSLLLQGKWDAAYDAFYKASWNDACKPSASLQLARIDCRLGRWQDALAHLDVAIWRNHHNHSARHLKCIILRKLNQLELAQAMISESLAIDPFHFGCLFEGYLLNRLCRHDKQAAEYLQALQERSRGATNNFLEYGTDYGNAGCYQEAMQLLALHVESHSSSSPTTYYLMAWYAANHNDKASAEEWLKRGAEACGDYCFPNKMEELQALQFAVQQNPADSKAWYYLGNYWYGMQQHEEAFEAFSQSIKHDASFPTAHRNLALLYFNFRQDGRKALAHLQQAFALDTSDARILMELDQLMLKLNFPLEERMQLLQQYPHLVQERDDLYLQQVALLNGQGQYQQALHLLSQRRFHPWEGGEGKVTGQYLFSLYMLATDALRQGQWQQAHQHLKAMQSFPENLGEGKLYGAPENDLYFLQGLAHLQAGEKEAAQLSFQQAAEGNAEPKPALFYNDPQPDQILYQGLAWLLLSEAETAAQIFHRLINYGTHHIHDQVKIDYFAVSLPEVLVFDKDLSLSHRIHCTYIKALGHLGLFEFETAMQLLQEVLALDNGHKGAICHQKLLQMLKQHMSWLFPIPQAQDSIHAI